MEKKKIKKQMNTKKKKQKNKKTKKKHITWEKLRYFLRIF